jgi:hypothetical protein
MLSLFGSPKHFTFARSQVMMSSALGALAQLDLADNALDARAHKFLFPAIGQVAVCPSTPLAACCTQTECCAFCHT